MADQATPKADAAKFITRGEHEQHVGYAPWLASVLNRLYARPPASARELVEQSAEYMRPHSSRDWERIEKQGIEKILRMNLTSEDNYFEVFGPAQAPDYGAIHTSRRAFYTVGELRDYNQTFARNYPDEMNERDHPAFKTRQFFYPLPDEVPGAERRLALMSIGLGKNFSEQVGESVAESLFFRHPPLTPEKYDQFIGCLEPLYSAACDKRNGVEERRDAAVTFYWLMAQMTPASRGGSAHARVTLEYLASQAGFQVPHTKEGYDLWAEAASTPLERFKEGFKEGRFFDPAMTSRKVMLWQRKAFQKIAERELGQQFERINADIGAIEGSADRLEVQEHFVRDFQYMHVDVTSFPEHHCKKLPAYYFPSIREKVIKLAASSKKLASMEGPLELKLQSRPPSTDEHYDTRLAKEPYDYLKPFCDTVLPEWHANLESDKHMDRRLHAMLTEAVASLQQTLPVVIAKAEEHSQAAPLPQMRPEGTLPDKGRPASGKPPSSGPL